MAARSPTAAGVSASQAHGAWPLFGELGLASRRHASQQPRHHAQQCDHGPQPGEVTGRVATDTKSAARGPQIRRTSLGDGPHAAQSAMPMVRCMGTLPQGLAKRWCPWRWGAAAQFRDKTLLVCLFVRAIIDQAFGSQSRRRRLWQGLTAIASPARRTLCSHASWARGAHPDWDRKFFLFTCPRKKDALWAAAAGCDGARDRGKRGRGGVTAEEEVACRHGHGMARRRKRRTCGISPRPPQSPGEDSRDLTRSRGGRPDRPPSRAKTLGGQRAQQRTEGEGPSRRSSLTNLPLAPTRGAHHVSSRSAPRFA